MRDPALPLSIRWLGEVDYVQAWELQKQIAAARAAGTGPDTALLLSHPAVYTAGKRTRPEDRPIDGSQVIDVDRGGRITWHGPGQLVGYPLIKLADPVDVVAYVRSLEQLLIETCDELGVAGAGRVEGRSGVWLPADATRGERKVAAIGVRVARGVTMHGFALNCDADLTGFDRIVPCGITDAGVTTLSLELGRQVSVEQARTVVERKLPAALSGRLRLTERSLERTALPVGVAWDLHPVLSAS